MSFIAAHDCAQSPHSFDTDKSLTNENVKAIPTYFASLFKAISKCAYKSVTFFGAVIAPWEVSIGAPKCQTTHSNGQLHLCASIGTFSMSGTIGFYAVGTFAQDWRR